MKTLYERGMKIIQARTQWEQKQRLYWQMRHDGLRRRNKPFPGAADLHFPLIDMNIRKGKPFWMAQAVNSDLLASFVSLKQQDKAMSTSAAEYFDFEMKQNTNYLVELFRCIDIMCLRGRGVLKSIADPFNEYRLTHKAIDPVFLLVPPGGDDLDEVDEFIHVQHYSVPAYQRNRRLIQDEALIQQIRGRKQQDQSQGKTEDEEIHEGINFSDDANQILVWEHWQKTINGWTLDTYSPMKPDAPLRKRFSCPYKGLDGKPVLPFVSYKMEITDEGWYAPRGMGELGAPFEAYACKLWNEKTDAMTYTNRPVFTSDKEIQNTANIRWAPGEFIPGNIKNVQMAAPAFSFDQEIAFARSTSEQQNMLPDFGIQQPGQAGEGNSPRTATENNRIASLQSVGTEATGMIFRLDLTKQYRLCWALMLQFQREKLQYFAQNELKQLDKSALHRAYLIMPDGSPDQWNKGLKLQRAMQRYQTYKGNPNVDQDVLTRGTMAADDPKFAIEAFIPSGVSQAKQAEDEAMEIVIMQDGFPAAVQPNEDHATRIHVLVSWLATQAQQGKPVNPVAQQRVVQHMALHLQYLKQQDPKAAAQALQQIEQLEQASSGRPSRPGQGAGPTAGPAPGNGPAGPAGMMPGNPS